MIFQIVVQSIPIRNCNFRVCVTDIESPKVNSLDSRKGGKVEIPKIQNISAKNSLVNLEANSQDLNAPIMMAFEQPLTTMTPLAPLTMPRDLAKAHYNHLRKIYGSKHKKVRSKRMKEKNSIHC